MADFTALLDKKLDDVEAPVLLPQGVYLMTIAQYRTGESRQKGTPYVEFDLKISSPVEVEDQESLAKVKNLSEKTMKTQFYLTDDSLFRLKDFLAKTGLPVEGRSFTEILSEISGAQIQGIVSHRVNPKNAEQVFAEVNNFLAA